MNARCTVAWVLAIGCINGMKYKNNKSANKALALRVGVLPAYVWHFGTRPKSILRRRVAVRR